MKFNPTKAITDIGLDYGYSPSNYSSLFRKHHDTSPAVFWQSDFLSTTIKKYLEMLRQEGGRLVLSGKENTPVAWDIQYCDLPAVIRYGKKCGKKREYICYGEFRVNAQKKAMDISLYD